VDLKNAAWTGSVYRSSFTYAANAAREREQSAAAGAPDRETASSPGGESRGGVGCAVLLAALALGVLCRALLGILSFFA